MNIYLNISNTHTLLWTQNGDKGSNWLNGLIPIHSSLDYRITIEAVRGLTKESSIAIDDIDFIEKECQFWPLDADPANFVTIPFQASTRSMRPPNQYDCQFENGFCMWTAPPENTFSWSRVQGTLGTIIAGPIPVDHTYGDSNSFYLFANVENKVPSDRARLHSNEFSGTRCMEFYYYFFAPGTKYTFNVFVKVN